MRAEWEQEYVEYVRSRLNALRRTALNLAGDADRGDDLVQQTITKLYLKWRRARDAGNLDAYVHTMLVRTLLDTRRLGWARVAVLQQLPERAVPAGDEVEDRTVLRAALAQLPPGQRAVLVLRFLADYSVVQTAEILGCAPGTVKSQTVSGLAALRRRLHPQLAPSTEE